MVNLRMENRRRAMVLALAAIPFWSAVALLGPLVDFRQTPPSAPTASDEPAPPPAGRLIPCTDLEQAFGQSRTDCVFRHRPTPSMYGPGDYPLRRTHGLVADSVGSSGRLGGS